MFDKARMAAAGLAATGALFVGAVSTQAARAEEPQFFTKAAVGEAAPTEVKETYSVGISYMEGHRSKAKIECRKGSGSAVVNGAKSTKQARINFTECEIAGFMTCENHGTKEIETNNLVGELGLISSATDGLRLKAETGAYVMEFPCAGGAVVIKVKGSLIGEITGSAKAGETIAQARFTASGGLKFAERGGIQKYTEFLGEAEGHQLENVVKEGAMEHEELGGQFANLVVKSVPAFDIGETT